MSTPPPSATPEQIWTRICKAQESLAAHNDPAMQVFLDLQLRVFKGEYEPKQPQPWMHRVLDERFQNV